LGVLLRWVLVGQRKSFEQLLLEAIEEALSLFGGSVKEVVLFYCSTKHGVSREQLPVKLNSFVKCLEEIFSYASRAIEMQVASRLYAKLGLSFVHRKDRRLIDYVEEARRRYEG